MQKILIIGAGYAGERLARAHLGRGDEVITTRRTAQASDPVSDAVPDPACLALDLDHRKPVELPVVDRVYYTAPPGREGREDGRLRWLLEQLPAKPLLVYFSTTGVYGDVAGAWINEESRLQPNNDRSRRRVDAEAAVSEWAVARNAAAVILRVTGIYGPGRLPLSRLQERRPVLDPAVAGFSNRIHIDDLVRAALATADLGESAVFNVADGNPTSTAEFLDAAAELASLPQAERIDWATAKREFSEMALSFMRDNKRVDVTRLENLPNFEFLYPDFRDGLRASLEEEQKAG